MTKRESAIYRFIIKYITKHCYPPTIREICDEIKASSSTIHSDLHNMIEKGYLETDSKDNVVRNRAIRVAGYKFVKS